MRTPDVFCDTGWLVALYDVEDDYHSKAEALHEDNRKERRNLYTHWGVIGETLTLMCRRASRQNYLSFVASLSSYRIFDLTPGDSMQIVGLYTTLTKDKFLSYVDVTSYFFVTQRLAHPPVLTFDRDFRRLGVRTLP